MWYGVILLWTNIRLVINFSQTHAPIVTFDPNTVRLKGKQVSNWFLRELFTKYSYDMQEGEHRIDLKFEEQREIEIEGKEYQVVAIGCLANRVIQKKRKWMQWTGDGFFDWHKGQITVPAKSSLVGTAKETDLSEWQDFDGEIPDFSAIPNLPGLFQAILYNTQKWDPNKDQEVPDLGSL